MLSEDHWTEIEESLNLLSLAPTLLERGLLSFGDHVDESRGCRQKFLREIRRQDDSVIAFSACFVPGERYEHLGHASLLHGRSPFAEEMVMKLSSHYETVFRINMTKVIQLINVKQLVPHLLEKRLLTPDEATSFDSSKGNKEIFRLFKLLKSKGPTAFSLFVDCIRDEKQHCGHKELHTLVTEQFEPLVSPEGAKPCELSCGEALTSQEYHDRRHLFEMYYHSGQWEECERLAEECMESTVIEVQVIGHLELALSYVFRVCEERVVYHITEAEVLCKQLENFNRTFLSGRCKYLLALLYHYLGDVFQARKYVCEAKEILFGVKVGEDKTFTAYCDAIISASNLTKNSSEFEFHEVIQKFETSLYYSSHTYDMGILTIYSFLRLGRLYLGRTEMKITVCQNRDRIQRSKDCQLKLETDFYSKMDDRCKGLYHLEEYDVLCMSVEENSSERHEQLKAAEYYVQRSKCSMDAKNFM